MASTQPTLRCAYRYDPLDQLINQTQPDMPALQRFYCKSRLATEIQGTVKHSIFQQGDHLLAQQQHHGDSLNTTLLATDLQRSVLQTFKVEDQLHPIAYTAYGHRPIASGLLSLLGFNGERPDTVTGHYLLGNGYRAFNPVLMRFNSPDSLSPFGRGGINSYVYCLGNPTSLLDPSGHSPYNPLAAKLLGRALKRSRSQVAPMIDSRVKKPKYAFKSKTGPEQVFEWEAESKLTSLTTNDGTTTLYMNDTGVMKKTINSPSLKQLSFSAAMGHDLQKLANSSQASAKLIIETDQSIGDINLNNFLNNISHQNPTRGRLDRTSFNAQTAGYASAMDGEQPGILPTRAVSQIIRYGNDAENPNTTLKNRFPHLFN